MPGEIYTAENRGEAWQENTGCQYDCSLQDKVRERGVTVSTLIDANTVVGQIGKHHATLKCYKALGT
ncbi:hypothetical protein SDC9_186769 [bioreactor metagenome]|uniref:Uncharacterized protein n=1 Tax=bioreactor metagenome TaxID=1076179 RepID=A0A645HJP4_9ZZZZ